MAKGKLSSYDLIIPRFYDMYYEKIVVYRKNHHKLDESRGDSYWNSLCCCIISYM